jgi:hypothetical protein
MKAIQTHTAVIRDNQSRADAGEILKVGEDISAARAKELVAEGSAVEFVEAEPAAASEPAAKAGTKA